MTIPDLDGHLRRRTELSKRRTMSPRGIAAPAELDLDDTLAAVLTAAVARAQTDD